VQKPTKNYRSKTNNKAEQYAEYVTVNAQLVELEHCILLQYNGKYL